MKLFWTYFNVCDHNTSTSQAKGRTETVCYDDTALCVSHRAVKLNKSVNFGQVIGHIECIKLSVWVLSRRECLTGVGLSRDSVSARSNTNYCVNQQNRPDE